MEEPSYPSVTREGWLTIRFIAPSIASERKELLKSKDSEKVDGYELAVYHFMVEMQRLLPPIKEMRFRNSFLVTG